MHVLFSCLFCCAPPSACFPPTTDLGAYAAIEDHAAFLPFSFEEVPSVAPKPVSSESPKQLRLNFQGSFVEWLYMDHKFVSYELQTRAIPLGPSAVSFSMTIWSAIDLKGVGGMGYCVPLQHPRTLAFS